MPLRAPPVDTFSTFAALPAILLKAASHVIISLRILSFELSIASSQIIMPIFSPLNLLCFDVASVSRFKSTVREVLKVLYRQNACWRIG